MQRLVITLVSGITRTSFVGYAVRTFEGGERYAQRTLHFFFGAERNAAALCGKVAAISMAMLMGWALPADAAAISDIASLSVDAKRTDNARQSNPGNLKFTENRLNLAVADDSFFVLGGSIQTPAGEVRYTHDGAFHIDHDGYLVSAGGKPLLGYLPNDPGDAGAGFRTGMRGVIKVNARRTDPAATREINLGLNLYSAALPPIAAAFSTLDANSYNYAVSVNIFDSLGTPHTVTAYFVKVSAAETAPQAVDIHGNTIGGAVWKMYVDVDNSGSRSVGGGPPTGIPLSEYIGITPILLEFDTSGNLLPPALGENAANNALTTPALNLDGTPLYPPVPGPTIHFTPTSGAAPLSFTLNMTGSTQFYAPDSVNNLTQDGYAVVKLTGVAIDESGVLHARYNNGSAKTVRVLGAVALAKFPAPQALFKWGDGEWAETTASGTPIFGAANIRQVWQARFRRFGKHQR